MTTNDVTTNDATTDPAVVAQLVECVGSEHVELDHAARLAASRDYAWMSPILSAKLPDRVADVVVRPTVAQVPDVLALAHRHGLAVTPRGRGTGNYGQAIPLAGGVVLDLTRCDTIRSIDGDLADVEPGVSFSALERAAREHGREVAVMPSMLGSTIGGFLSGGNQGIGSIAHGSIWDGWVRELDVVGCAARPVPFTVADAGVRDHLHTYGTAGVLVGARLRLAPRREYTVLFAAFHGLSPAAAAGRELMHLTPAPRVLSVADRDLGRSLPAHLGVMPGRTMLRVAVEVGTLAAAQSIVSAHGGTPTATDSGALSALYGSVYNHITMRTLRLDPSICALQVRGDALLEHLPAVRESLPDVRLHLDGNAPAQHGVGYSGLLMSRWVDRETLMLGAERLRSLGVRVIDPHTWMLGGHGDLGAMRTVADRVDPAHLLNPGKLPAAA